MLKILFSRLFYLLVFSFLSTACFGQFNYYFGNLHAHSHYSDGCKDSVSSGVSSPRQCFNWGKDSEHLDFLGISEHNHNVQNTGMQLQYYAMGLREADEENDDGNFVCMYGLEFGLNKYGHVLIYGLSQLPGWEAGNYDIKCKENDFSKLWSLIDDDNAFATLAHPEKEHFNSLSISNRRPSADKVICGTAVESGPYDSRKTDFSVKPDMKFYKYYRTLLALGYRVGPTIDHDNHYTTFGRMSTSRTVVLAPSLTRNNIILGYKAMRFYASEDWDTQVNFTIRNKPMGSEISGKINPVIKVKVTEPEEDDPIKYIKIMFGRAGSKELPTALGSIANSDSIIVPHNNPSVGSTYYYYAEIEQKDGDKIVTAPIWFKKTN
jgi:hypothetical protein